MQQINLPAVAPRSQMAFKESTHILKKNPPEVDKCVHFPEVGTCAHFSRGGHEHFGWAQVHFSRGGQMHTLF